jgi:hypothetical protein
MTASFHVSMGLVILTTAEEDRITFAEGTNMAAGHRMAVAMSSADYSVSSVNVTGRLHEDVTGLPTILS